MQHNRPLLILFFGSPGSGKSYFAEQLAERIHGVRLNGDSMKVALFGSYEAIRAEGRIQESNQRGYSALNYVTGQILQAGHTVVFDANNNKRSSRDALRQIANQHGGVVVVVCVNTPAEIARERALHRESSADKPSFTESEYHETLARQKAATVELGDDENYIDVDGTKSFDSQYEVIVEKLDKITSEV